MEHLATEKPKTREEINKRLQEINNEKLRITNSLDSVSEEFNESRSGDDDATEYESTEQKLNAMSDRRAHLELEEDELRKQLAAIDQAA